MSRGKRLLDGPQRFQVIEMVKAGKTPEEIIGFVKQTYDVEINSQYLNNVRASLGMVKRSAAAEKKEKKPRGPRKDKASSIAGAEIPEGQMSDEEIIRDTMRLIRESTILYRIVFMVQRRELLKTIDKLRKMKKEFAEQKLIEADLEKTESRIHTAAEQN